MSPEFATNLFTIGSLVVIEGLLSVDNVLGIATLAKALPEHQQKKAIRLGMIGAYVFRIIALLVAAWLIQHTWVRWVGAGYLVYLMCSHLGQATDADGDGKIDRPVSTFTSVLIQISLMDLMLSIDNVITAVTLAPKGPDGLPIMWPIYTGVTLSIFALQLLAPTAIRLLDRYPILGPTAFVLLGFVGGILMVEEGAGLHVSPVQKFIGIAMIIAIAMAYDKVPAVNALLKPLFRVIQPIMRAVGSIGHLLIWPFKALVGKK